MTTSSDGTPLYFERSGRGDTTLLFVHGWLGNYRWWDAEAKAFSDEYQVVRMDLAGHGRSGGERTEWSAARYADDITAVADAVAAKRLVLVGHSMSGYYVVEAFGRLKDRVERIVLVDTLHDLDQRITTEDAAPFFEMVRKDFKAFIDGFMGARLFAPESPPEVVARIKSEFLQYDAETAVRLLAPMYATDVRPAARRVSVPVRAINSAGLPTNAEVNRRYFPDFDYVTIEKTGHYPMLERPDEFNALLRKFLSGSIRR